MFPAVFLSHGAPLLLIEEGPAHQFLKELGGRVGISWGKPKAILVLSAHWETETPMVSADPNNTLIYDFFGFPNALYHASYPAPQSPWLVEQTVAALLAADLPVFVDHGRGLDHGAWVPLKLIFPDADIPVAQLSIQPALGPLHHLQLGKALASLREQGVLVVGSGSLTHNLRELMRASSTDGAPEWVTAFSEWVYQKLQAGDEEALLNYRKIAPYAERSHPTEEHFLPLFAAFGARTPGGKVERLHASATYGTLRMDFFAFH